MKISVSQVHEGQTTNEAFIPSQLLYLIWTHENHLAGFEEQDAQELLMALFNIIHSQHSTDDGKSLVFRSISSDESLSLLFQRMMKRRVRVSSIDSLKVLFNPKSPVLNAGK